MSFNDSHFGLSLKSTGEKQTHTQRTGQIPIQQQQQQRNPRWANYDDDHNNYHSFW